MNNFGAVPIVATEVVASKSLAGAIVEFAVKSESGFQHRISIALGEHHFNRPPASKANRK